VKGGRIKLYDFDRAQQVKAAITDIHTPKRYVAAAKVNSKRPKYAIEDETFGRGGIARVVGPMKMGRRNLFLICGFNHRP
jgi:hypothetical protein